MTRLTPDDLPRSVREAHGLEDPKPERPAKRKGSRGPMRGQCSCGETFKSWAAYARHSLAHEGQPGHRWEINLNSDGDET